MTGAARSKLWVCGLSLSRTVDSNPAGDMDVSLFECCVLSCRGLGLGLITRPEKSY
jgi:hypothetical protein